MIYTERKVSIKNDIATIDSPIILFRGDREVEIMFTIVDSKFKFESNKGNVIDKTQAAFGQLAVDLPDGTDLFTEIVECENGVVVFSITGEMIDEIHEVGFYSFHIRLFNDDKTSRITLPPVMEGIEIREPLIIEGDVENTDLVGDATVGYSMVQAVGTDEEVFDEEGNYIPTVWGIGDKITAEKLNKIEEGVVVANENDLSDYITKNELPLDDLYTFFGNKYNNKIVLMQPTKVLKKVYSTFFVDGAELSDNYCTYECDVEPGEKYTINTVVLEDKSYAPVLFYNDEMYVDCVDKNEVEGRRIVEDLHFTIPEGVNKIKMTTETYYVAFKLVKNEVQVIEFKEYNNTLDEMIVNNIRTIPAFAYELDDNGINVIYKMKDIDFMVRMGKFGGNGLFDFHKFGVIKNDNIVPSNDFANVDILKISYTDWHSPFHIGALNNADGTNKNDNGDFNIHYTGGNHQYNNQGSGSIPTARLVSVTFMVDNKLISNGTGYGNRLEIQWVNHVQGYNTTKEDGTGREILKEIHTMIFDGHDWVSHVELVALEDLKMLTGYGFQATLTTLWDDNIRYIGGTNRMCNSLSTDSDCGENKAFRFVAEGTEYGISVELDNTYDVGTLTHNSDMNYIFTLSNVSKTYFNLIKNMDMLQDEHYCYRGTYHFYKK